MPLLAPYMIEERQSINAVYYRNTALAPRIPCFLDYLVDAVGARPFED